MMYSFLCSTEHMKIYRRNLHLINLYMIKYLTLFSLHVLCEIWWVLYKDQNFTNICVEVAQNMYEKYT